MNIPYVEIIGKYTMTPFALVEAQQCWFELSYYDIGEFEVYAVANDNNLKALQKGNYVRIPHKPYIWIIKSIEYKFTANGAKMISAKGYEAKWIISSRIIMTPWMLPTNLQDAVYQLVNNNCGLKAVSYRKIVGFQVVQPSYNITIEQTQATRGNLWEFIQPLMKTNNVGSYATYSNWNIFFNSILGKDLSNKVIFSQTFDNLISSDYYSSSANKRTYCQVVSNFNENDMSVDYVQDYDLGDTGIDRSEMSLASNISTKYTDANGNEQETSPSSDLYKGWQQQEGKNTLAENIVTSEFQGEIDLENSKYVFAEDFFIGDVVKIMDEQFGYEAKARIIKYTFKQEANGYGEEAEYLAE